MKHFIQHFSVWFSNPRNRLSLGISLVLILMLSVYGAQSNSAVEADPEWLADEMIPEGFSLVPLELQNREALQALIGNFATVNLYTSSIDGITRGQIVGRKIKLIRSPRMPDQFSALVPSDEAALLLAQPLPLMAVVLKRSLSKDSELIQKQKKNSRIQFLTEDQQ